jgi:hypothetical protein
MTQAAHPHPSQLPTLTEVIELTLPTPVTDAGMTSAPPTQGVPDAAPIVTGGLASNHRPSWAPMTTVVLPTLNEVAMPMVASALPAIQAPALEVTEAQLAQRVLGVVQKQIDGMIDFRLKEALAPILARHSEALVRDLREELSRTMADVVARAVAQEMAKLRHR